MVKKILLVAGCCALAACAAGMDGALGRTTVDPFEEIPAVTSFNGDFSIVISWKTDEAADGYYLYRAKDDLNPQYRLVYTGPLTAYRDGFTPGNAEEAYLYRLGKRRGGRLFVDLAARGKAGLGVVSGSGRDRQEPNNTREQASPINDITLEANSWYYSSNTYDRISIYDGDWYRVAIPSHWTATVILKDLDPYVDPFTGAGSSLNHFKIEKLGIGSEDIATNTPMEIKNTSNKAGIFYFRIYPNVATFENLYFNAPPLGSGGCGKFIRYTITVSEIRQGI